MKRQPSVVSYSGRSPRSNGFAAFARDERRARHRLLAARDEQVAVARDHGVARADDRREAGGAEPVDRDAADRVGKPREQRGHARDVAVVLAGLVRGAEPDVLDLLRRDARARDRFAIAIAARSSGRTSASAPP